MFLFVCVVYGAKVQKKSRICKFLWDFCDKNAFFVILTFANLRCLFVGKLFVWGLKKINGGFLSRTLPSYMCQNLVLAVSTRVCSEVLCVVSNTRSAIRSTSSPAQIEICGVPHWKRSERLRNKNIAKWASRVWFGAVSTRHL